MSINGYSKGDYYPVMWDKEMYLKQFELIAESEEDLIVDANHHFIPKSQVEKTDQVATEIFDLTSELLKFAHYGVTKKWLNSSHFTQQHKGKVFNSDIFRQFFQSISDAESTWDCIYQFTTHLVDSPVNIDLDNVRKQKREDLLSIVRQFVIDYHKKEEVQLTSAKAEKTEFGDTPLQLAREALSSEKPDFRLALKYFTYAHHLKNTDPAFQRKLGAQFIYFLNQAPLNWDSNEFHHIREILLSLFSIALKVESVLAPQYLSELVKFSDDTSNQKIVNLLLKYKKYDSIKQYPKIYERCQALLSAIANTQNNLSLISNHYIGLKEPKKALQMFQDAIKRGLSQKFVNYQMAELCANHLDNPVEAIRLFQLGGNEGPLRALYVFVDQFERDSTSFFTQFEPLLWTFLNSHSSFKIIEENNRRRIGKMICECLFNAESKKEKDKVSPYFKKGLSIGIEFLYEFIDHIGEILKTKKDIGFQKVLENLSNNFSNKFPSIQDKIVRALWNIDRKKALAIAIKFIERFKNHDFEKLEKEHLSNLHARVAQDCLTKQNSWFDRIRGSDGLSEAFKYLDEGMKIYKSTLTRSVLADAHIIAGDSQSGRAAISCYEKAFEIFPKKGNYLKRWMQLNREHGDLKVSEDLYERIKNQSWGHDFKTEFEIELN